MTIVPISLRGKLKRVLKSSVLLLLLCGGLRPGGRVVNAVVAVVYGEPITISDLRELLPGEEDPSPELWRSALQALIEKKLLLRAAAEEGIEVAEREVESKLRAALSSDAIDSEQKDALKKQVRQNLLIRRLLLRKIGFISVRPSAISAYYEAHKSEYAREEMRRFRMILLRTEKEADEMLAQLAKGKSFDSLAKDHSVGPRKDEGGDWGWVARRDLKEPLASAVFSMKKGEVRGALKLDDNYAILRLEEIRPAGPQPLSEVTSAIKEILYRQEFIKRRNSYIEELKKWADITIFEDRLPK